MAKKQTIEHIIHSTLKDKIAFGQSKYAEKQNLGFGESSYKIFSYSTYNTYLKECKAYGEWLKEEKGINKIDKIEKTEEYAKEYLQNRLDSGVSVYTVKMERSALGMLYGKKIEIDVPKRDNKAIKRSRNDVENDRHYARNGKYKDVFVVGLATGCRRKDLINLTTNSLVEKDGHLYVQIFCSKGGRNRISPVREEYAEQVREIISKRQREGKNKVFDKIPSKIDIHSLRREYCKGLYKDITGDRQLRDDILKNYPPRKELKTNIDKNGHKYTKEIKSDYYRDRDGNVWDRDDVFLLSQALGHSRLEVSCTHYLR